MWRTFSADFVRIATPFRPLPAMRVVFDASARCNPIIMGTVIVCLVFLPQCSCRGSRAGSSGRWPRRTSSASSHPLLVALTVTPVLSYYLPAQHEDEGGRPGPALVWEGPGEGSLTPSPAPPRGRSSGSGARHLPSSRPLRGHAGLGVQAPFNEGTATVNVILQLGVSLAGVGPDRPQGRGDHAHDPGRVRARAGGRAGPSLG